MKETNMEHFRSEIERIIYSESCEFAPAVIDGRPTSCYEGNCKKCKFSAETTQEECSISFVKWLMAEYKPEPVLTAREKGFVECVVDGWIARDKNGDLKWSGILFDRDSVNGMWYLSKVSAEAYLREDYFPFITWEDEEPWAVKDLRKLKVEGGEADE